MRAIVLALILLVTIVPPVSANHYVNYRWRGNAPITVTVKESLTDARLDDSLRRALDLWSQSAVIDMAVTTKGKTMVEVSTVTSSACCFIAATQVSHDSRGYITGVIIKLNDWALDNSFGGVSLGNQTYRDYVLCHEIGHALALDHRTDPYTSCMTTASPGTVPDAHDFEELLTIYGN